ncbi:MAG: hypothetical protein WEA61_01940 [Anaerolineales bacterium]
MNHKVVSFILFLGFAVAACSSPAANPTAVPAEPVVELEPTATLALPTNTPTPEPSPTATPNLAATAAAQATEQAAVVIGSVGTHLELVGFSLDKGSLAFVQSEPISITVTGPRAYAPVLLTEPNPVFGNFVLGVDVTWESETGLAGCAIRFRGDEDIVRGQYGVFNAVRLSGLPGWDIELYKFDQYQASLTGDYRPNAAILQGQGTTNHYILVANGSTLTVYANGTRLGSGTANAALVEGQIAFEAWQESGLTTCTFSNAWVWELPAEEE